MTRQILITPAELRKFLTQEQHVAFLERIIERINSSSDYEEYKGEPIWVLAEW